MKNKSHIPLIKKREDKIHKVWAPLAVTRARDLILLPNGYGAINNPTTQDREIKNNGNEIQ
jgi:hypothetical protein